MSAMSINENECDEIAERDRNSYDYDEKIDGSCKTCKFNLKVFKHPSNTNPMFKGSIREFAGFCVCTGFENGEAIIQEDRDSYCENYEESEK